MFQFSYPRQQAIFYYFISIVFIVLPISAFSEAKINIDNWTTNSEILEIRKLYGNIKNGIKSGELTVLKRHYKTDPYSANKMRCNSVNEEIALNRNKRARFYKFEHMQRDIVITTEHVFDEEYNLRFIYGSQDNDDAYSYRAYFKKDGSLIFAIQKDEGIAYEIKDIRNSMFLNRLSEKEAIESFRNVPSNCDYW